MWKLKKALRTFPKKMKPKRKLPSSFEKKKRGVKNPSKKRCLYKWNRLCTLFSLFLALTWTFPLPAELLIFVSFSLPDQSLKTYYAEAKRLGGRLVLQGLVDNSFQATAEKAKLLEIDFDIDPTLFEQYGVDIVPTMVLEGKETAKKVEGHLSLQSVLDIFQEQDA